MIKDECYSKIKSLCNTRDRLVKLRTSLKNKIHNILLAHGIITKREDFSSEKGLKRVQSYALGEIAEVELDVIVAQIRHLNEGIKKLNQEIESRGKRLKSYKNITSIKGIGPKSVMRLYWESHYSDIKETVGYHLSNIEE